MVDLTIPSAMSTRNSDMTWISIVVGDLKIVITESVVIEHIVAVVFNAINSYILMTASPVNTILTPITIYSLQFTTPTITVTDYATVTVTNPIGSPTSTNPQSFITTLESIF